MDHRIKEAFGQIRAESALKNKTRDYIFHRTKGYRRAGSVNYKRLAAVFACAVILLVGGYRLYFTPTVGISIDINPSVELDLNRFDRVISVKSYNEDGRELLASVDIKFMDYSEAVSQIVENENVVSLLANGGILTITVIGKDGAQSEEILSKMQSYVSGKSNTYCYHARPEEAESAHKAGLSCGKYRAYLELQALDPGVTVEEIRDMTMREIRDRINELSDDGQSEAEPSGNGHGHCRRSRADDGPDAASE